MRTRNWSIRSKIIALAAVPLTALLALWVFATGVTAGPAMKLLSAQTLVDKVGSPGERLVGQLQLERRLSVAYLSDDQAVPPALVAQRVSTDRAAADFRRSAGSADAQDAADDVLRTRIRQLVSDLDGLNENRQHIDRREVDALGAQNLYNSMVESGFRMFVATAAFGDERIDRKIRAVVTIARGQDYLSRTNSLVGGALAAGELSAPARNDLVQAISMSRFLLAEGVTDLPAQDRTAYQKLSTGASFSRLSELQDELLSDSRPGTALPITAAEWRPTFDTATQQLTAFEVNAVAALPGDARPVAVDVLVRLGLAGLLGLIAFIISIIVSVRVGRSMVGRLTRLRGEALEMAGERLPTVVKRLQRGEAVDVEVETPPLEYGRDEIGQLGRAFNEVQRTAVQSAVEEANVRRGINEVFLNIARRSQTLLHRQLALLDKMERRETEPDELEDLYRVDHLATRMRRHAEDLVILAGAAPGRGWRNPVPVIDVVRGAISEVEDYKRVDIVSVESSAVLGRAVGDVIHLLAELLENAASFSPPQTRVQVVGQVLPNGYALEIEDRGLGMSPEALAEANRKLLEPPDFDPADSARLGLFVVAQLADRHGIRVSLRPSGYGGVTAVVLVPGELVTTGQGQGQAALPAGPTPPDTSWDRPLVGSGTEDPARSSLGALQWQGTEQVRSIAMTGRPVTINGTATAGPELTDDTVRPGSDRHEPATATGADVGDPTRPLSRHSLGLSDTPVAEPAEPAATLGGPAPSAVVDGLTEDGLVQRRRTKPRRGSGQRAAPPALLPPNLTSPDGLSSAPGSSAPGSAAAGFPAPGSAPATPVRPESLSSDFPSAGNGRTTTNGNGLTGAGLNVPGVGGPALDGPGVGGPALDGPGVGGPALDGPGLNGPALDGAGLNGPGLTGSGPDGLSLDGPLRHGEGPAMLGTPPQVPPRIPSPRVAPKTMPGAPKAMPPAAPTAMPKDAPADDPSADQADEPLLPRRVRQASLAPQLRGPVAEQTAAPSRSPEQVRSLMSALQQGTTRGRREAAGLAAAAAGSAPDDRASNGPETDKEQTVGEPMWSEAATVIFPAVQDPVAAGSDNSTDNAPENHENQPDKDA
ncbi:nitrate- and nitrite sensing domain-containing protein [Actinoplanes sp. CA-051413]|uniref:sensor histidine kinase n=1 Tax=Actinoplanes sp. CA-051413 TaxID=3239899 RepID=UPI003D98536A